MTMDQKLLLDQKWKKLMKLAGYFRFVPFLDFAVATGSMAVGNVKESSDFDALISVEKGRIFTVRYIINFVFSLLGKRRLDDLEDSSPDKLCFNHFVTEETWRIKPINSLSVTISRNWVPLWGNKEKIKKFLKINSTTEENLEGNLLDLRFSEKPKSVAAKIAEKALGGRGGDFLENKVIGVISRKRLGKYLAGKPRGERVIVSEKEMEFHFNPKF